MRTLAPAEFADAVQNYAAKTVKSIAKDAAAKVFTDLAARIIENTPVLTGRARANWNASTDTPDLSTTTDVAGVDTTGVPLTGAEKVKIDAVVQQFRQSDEATSLYLSNGLDYINSLNDGNSLKAPAGIIEPAIAVSLDDLKRKGES